MRLQIKSILIHPWGRSLPIEESVGWRMMAQCGWKNPPFCCHFYQASIGGRFWDCALSKSEGPWCPNNWNHAVSVGNSSCRKFRLDICTLHTAFCWEWGDTLSWWSGTWTSGERGPTFPFNLGYVFSCHNHFTWSAPPVPSYRSFRCRPGGTWFMVWWTLLLRAWSHWPGIFTSNVL